MDVQSTAIAARARTMRFLKLCLLLVAPGITVLTSTRTTLFRLVGPPVNLGPAVNSIGIDDQPFESKDGVSLYLVVLEGVSG